MEQQWSGGFEFFDWRFLVLSKVSGCDQTAISNRNKVLVFHSGCSRFPGRNSAGAQTRKRSA